MWISWQSKEDIAMKVKNTLSLTIGSLSFSKEPKALESSTEVEDGVKSTFMFPKNKSGFQISDLKLDMTIDDELSDAEFQANVELAKGFFQALSLAVPSVISSISELESEKARLRHYHKVEEMKLQDQLDAAKHQRIQESKGGKPLTAEETKDLILKSNEDLVSKLVSSVRVTRTS